MFSTILLQLIVFFLPTQLGLHFWPDFSRAAGIKVDYLSPTLYFVDLLLISYLFLNLKAVSRWLIHHLWPVELFLLFILLNTVLGVSPLNSAFWWCRLVLYLLFFLILRLRKVRWSQIQTPLLLSTFLIILLEILQLINQSSIGGLFYWLGERDFSSSTPGLGRLSLFGLDFIRPQSTFSHPNSLAGYLLLVYYLLHLKKFPLWSRLIVFVGLLMTLSKAAFLAFLLISVFHINFLFLIFTFLLLSISQVFLPNTSIAVQFISDRLFLLTPTKKIILSSPLLGVGLGGYIPTLAEKIPGSFLLPAKLQPVHNLILLAVSEVGLLGVALLGLLTKLNLKRILNPQLLGVLAVIVITGTFDHYWWTLPQNRLLLLLATAVLL